jgi:head-tail adaptor
MRAGQFTSKFTVQRKEVVIDQFGGHTETWVDRYVDVKVSPKAIGSSAAGGGEYNEDDQMLGTAKYEFIVRYLPGLEMTDRILWEGGYFDIYQVFPIGRREGMRIRASWQDNQGDNFAFDTADAEQIIPDTGGLTISQVIAEYQYNTTGQTFPELADYFEEQNTVAPRIAYPNIIHMDDPDDVGVETWGPNGYQAKLAAGALSPGLAPSNILHIAEVDTVNDPEYLKTLVNNNEFGNKHRFTYDDGTEATEVHSNNITTLDGGSLTVGPGADGYTGDNPRYIIDHYTGLGWFRCTYGIINAASGDWWESRGIYDHYTDLQDLVDKPSTFTYGGFTDWRRPTGPEWTFGLGNVDWSNYMSGSDQSARDIYFPPLNQYVRGYGGLIMLLGPTDVNAENATAGFNWFMPATHTNGGYLTGIAQAALESVIAAGTGSTYSTLLCRRHYDNR